MWLGTIMWFNVWFVIWPNQQKALNIDGKYPDLPQPEKAAVGQDRGHVLPHQHDAVDPDAVLHGGGGASALMSVRSRSRIESRPGNRAALSLMREERCFCGVRRDGPAGRSGPLFLGPVRAGREAAISVRALCLQ